MANKGKARKRSGRGRSRRPPTSRIGEWVGGRLVSPFYITEGEPYRPEMVLWLELPQDLVVAMTLIDPSAPPVSFGDTLLEAMNGPKVGPPRRPARVRVADARLATEVRAVAPDIEVDVAPTPELNHLVRLMAESMPEGDEGAGPSYFEDSRVSKEAIETLFKAAQLLYRVAPWKTANDSQVVRLDIPQLGVEGACVSIIGALGESIGLIIFPSLLAYESFLAASDELEGSDGPIDVGTTTLSLNFERGADIPPSMRREVAEHGWPVAGPTAYPWVQHRDRDGLPRPLSERDVRVVAACATSLVVFFAKYRSLFESEVLDEPICESFFDDDDLEVRFTMPYEAGRLFEANTPPSRSASPASRHDSLTSTGAEHVQGAATEKVGRNEPCPCGSGKKYKKCCLGKDKAARAARLAPARVHELDQRLFEQMMQFAAPRFGEAWFLRAHQAFDDPDLSMQLFAPWMVYHVEADRKPVVQWYLEDQGHRLSNFELTWLQAQQASWLSVWEVRAVEPGQSITLEDLLTGEERTVQEVSGSRGIAPRDSLLARVVDHEGISVLGGNHPRPLPPVEAAEVVQRIRGRLRRKRAVPVDRLRDEKIGRYMIARWEETVEELDVRRSIPPRLQNTDGEEMLLTVDHFEFDAKARKEIERRLAALEGVDSPEPDDPDQAYVFAKSGNTMHQSWENTLIGRAALSAGKLRLETNSVQRADSLRARIEGACGELVRHRAREHSDPFSAMQDHRARTAKDEEHEIPPDQANELILEMKAKHYAQWPDDPLPALGGKTPREAIQTKAGRQQVDVLLKQAENLEARMPEGQRFDFAGLRQALGLEG